MQIDARGFECPKPVMMAEEALSRMREGIVEILVDNEGSAKNLTKFANTSALYADSVKKDNYWRVKIVKGYPCEVPVPERNEEPGKDLFMVIAADVMGNEEKLGKILMKGFFETMKVYKDVPDTIFFLNTGVRLTTIDEEVIGLLKELETMGVMMFTCGTCLKYFNLESELKIGYRGTTTNILEEMRDCRKTVWIG